MVKINLKYLTYKWSIYHIESANLWTAQHSRMFYGLEIIDPADP